MRLKVYEIVLLILLASGLHMPPAACSAQPDESQLKALFVLNFAKLTEWPADTHVDGSTFTIAILGKVPSDSFTNMLKGRTVHGASITIRLVDNVRQAKDSQLIYVSDSERRRLPGILKEVSQYSILTVSDMPGFSEAGGMIGMLPVQNRLGFEVNLAAVRKARLTVSSQVLKLAKTVFNN
jgi:hypothetical protein